MKAESTGAGESWAESEERTIEGVVTPARWDDEDHLAAVSLLADDVDEWAIAEEGCGHDLFAFVGERVRVTGTIEGDRLKVERYSVL